MKAWSIPKGLETFSNSVKTIAIVIELDAIEHYEKLGYKFTSRSDYDPHDEIEGDEKIYSFPEIDRAIAIIEELGYGFRPPLIPDSEGPALLPFGEMWAMLIAPRITDKEATQ